MKDKKELTVNEKLSGQSKSGTKPAVLVKPKNTIVKTKTMAKKKKSIIPWIIAILALMLGLNGYQWFTNNQLNKDFQTQKTEISEIKAVTAQLDKDYETAIESLEEMRGDNIELNELIDSQKTELADQKKKIKQLIWTKRELKKAKTEIQNISVLKDQYIAEVNDLKVKIANLEQDNTTLRTKNTELVGTLELEKADKATVILEKEKIMNTNVGLNKQVDMANAIKINFLSVQGYKEYDSGKLKKKSRAKNIHILRTCFTTETNMVTEAGEKNFKIRIIDPMGTTIYNEALGSGTIMEKLSEKKIQYTMSGDVQYDNEDKNACIDYRPSSPLAKGDYSVEMFNNSFLVGKGSFKLK